MSILREASSYLAAVLRKTTAIVLLSVDLGTLAADLAFPKLSVPVAGYGLLAVIAFAVGGFQVNKDERAQEKNRHAQELAQAVAESERGNISRAVIAVAQARSESSGPADKYGDPTPRFTWEPQAGKEYVFEISPDPTMWAGMHADKDGPGFDALPDIVLRLFGTIHNSGETAFEIVELRVRERRLSAPVSFWLGKAVEPLPIRVEPGARDLEVVVDLALRPKNQSEAQFAARMRAVQEDSTAEVELSMEVIGPDGTAGELSVERQVALRPLFRLIGELWRTHEVPSLPSDVWWAR